MRGWGQEPEFKSGDARWVDEARTYPKPGYS